MRGLDGDDGRNPGWFWADNKVLELHAAKVGIHAFAVYMALTKYANRNDQCWPSTKTLSTVLGISQRTVVKAIHVLDEYGLIILEERSEKGKGQISHKYTLVPADNLSPKATRNSDTPMHDIHRGYAPDAYPPMHDMHDPYARDAHEQDPVNKTQLTNDATSAAPPGQKRADERDTLMRSLDIRTEQRKSILKARPDLTVDEIRAWQDFISSPPDWCDKPVGYAIKSLRNGDPPPTNAHPKRLVNGIDPDDPNNWTTNGKYDHAKWEALHPQPTHATYRQ